VRGTLDRRTWQYDPALYAPAKYRKACAYRTFTPDPIAGFDAPIPAEVSGVISDAEAAVHGLNARARPALAPLSRLLLRTESIASSRLEGMQVDLRDLARAEVRAESGVKPAASLQEILGNIDAMELAVERASSADEIGESQIRSIHAALLAKTSVAGIGGQIRDRQNWIGGNDYNPCDAAFVPPPPESVPTLMADLCRAMAEEHLPPLMQAAVVHAQFETVHPFLDGNGRTGRALVHVVLRRRGLTPSYVPPVSVVLAARKDEYVAGLTAFREGDLAGWLTVFAVATARSAVLAQRYLEAVTARQESWRQRLADVVHPRADAAAWAVIDVLPAHPVIGVPVAASSLRRSKAVVNDAFNQLETAGVLRRLGGGERNRVWEAEGLLDLMATMESGREVHR
jgi:Fic family protein